MRTVEEKKTLLQEYATIGTDIETMQEQIARLKSYAEKITAGFEDNGSKSGSNFNDKIQICAERLEVLEDEYEKLCEEKVKLCELVDEALMKLPQIERYVLIERYIVGTKWFVVARVIGYEDAQFFRIEKKALENLEI